MGDHHDISFRARKQAVVHYFYTEIRCHRHSGVAKTICKMRMVTYVGMYAYNMYGHTYSKSIDQPGKVANPARGQLNREK